MEAWWKAHAPSMIEDIQRLVRIRSVAEEGTPDAPLGQGVKDSLAEALRIAEKLGLRTVNLDNYCGFAEAGEGEPLVAILAHVDIVPEGEGWSYPPFGAEVHDGFIYGRGIADDKGPAVAALYALAAVKDQLKSRVRVILGCDEESGDWKCMQRYKKTEPEPDMAFTPDSEYPLINTEKGILQLEVKGRFHQPSPLTMHAGTRVNVVPDTCIVTTDDAALVQLLQGAGGTVSGSEIRFTGVSSHASRPEQGINATWTPIAALAGLEVEAGMVIARLKAALVDGFHGEGLNLVVEDESGKMTVNLGLLELGREEFSFGLDFRYPVTYDFEKIYASVRQAFPSCEVSCMSHQLPHHIDATHPLVRTLLEVYTELTGNEGEAESTGGGTYARAFVNAVAFGAQLPGRPDKAHQKDECMAVEDLILNGRIFSHALLRLTGK